MLQRRKKWIPILLLVPLIFLLFTQGVQAEEYRFDGSAIGFGELLDQLPKELKNEFAADEMSTPTDAVQSLMNKLSISYWLTKLMEEFFSVFFPSLRTAAVLVGMLIIIASANLMSENLCGSSFGKILGTCCDICIAAVTVSVAEGMITVASDYLERLCSLMNVLIPMSELLLLMDASVTQLAVHKAAMLLYIGITSSLNNLLLKPMFGVLFGFTVSGTVFQQFGITGFIDGFKKFVMTVISVFTMLFSFILGLQTVLAKSADSLGLKTVRLALGSFIPIVGGTLSEALTTVKEGFGVIKSAAGIGGIVVILLLILPTAVSLFTNHMILSFCHMTAEILGCGNSAKIIHSIQSVLSILSALVYATSLLFVMALIIFAKIGGR